MEKMKFEQAYYTCTIDLSQMRITIYSKAANRLLMAFNVDTAIDSLEGLDELLDISFVSEKKEKDYSLLTFQIVSALWISKKTFIELHQDKIICYSEVFGNHQRITNVNYFLTHNRTENQTDYDKIYLPRFDWFLGEVTISTKDQDSLGCQQWLSPPPFSYAFLSDKDAIYCGVAPKIGAYNFLSMDYHGEDGPCFTLTYEGHTTVRDYFITPKIIMGFGFLDPNEAIEGYVKYLRQEGYLLADNLDKTIPSWWKEPIFCSWGQMRFDYREEHDGHENGSFINVTDYSTEVLHRRYMDVFEEKDIHPGTLIIDMGWAEQAALHKPSNKRWLDMRKFIDEQHIKGRKVLLWYTPVVTQGLPTEACMTLDGRPVAPDPSSPLYQSILRQEIYKMLSPDPDCLNADGFKIDFTQCTPSEEGRFTSYLDNFWALINEDNEKYFYKPLKDRAYLIQTQGDIWGVEVLKAYIELIYTNMKQVKLDSVLITHTANPYFAEVVDILRLNDLDGQCENVLAVMENRAKIAKICSATWLIDTDNDLMYDKKRWRDYIALQPLLGIPDTYYVNAIATSGERFDESDFDLLRKVWKDYRNQF